MRGRHSVAIPHRRGAPLAPVAHTLTARRPSHTHTASHRAERASLAPVVSPLALRRRVDSQAAGGARRRALRRALMHRHEGTPAARPWRGDVPRLLLCLGCERGATLRVTHAASHDADAFVRPHAQLRRHRAPPHVRAPRRLVRPRATSPPTLRTTSSTISESRPSGAASEPPMRRPCSHRRGRFGVRQEGSRTAILRRTSHAVKGGPLRVL